MIDVTEIVGAWPIIGDAVIASACSGLLLGAFGLAVVERQMIFATVALSQLSAAGLTVSHAVLTLAGISLWPELLPAIIAVLLTGVVAAGLGRGSSQPRDDLGQRLGVLYSLSAALVVVVGALLAQEAHDGMSILLGSAVLVSREDLWLLLATVVLVMASRGPRLELALFSLLDPLAARSQGVEVARTNGVTWMLFALVVVMTTHTLGALPVFALAVLPYAIVRPFVRGVRAAITASAVLAGSTGVTGYLVAFVLDLPVGATQTLLLVAMWAVSALVARR